MSYLKYVVASGRRRLSRLGRLTVTVLVATLALILGGLIELWGFWNDLWRYKEARISASNSNTS